MRRRSRRRAALFLAVLLAVSFALPTVAGAYGYTGDLFEIARQKNANPALAPFAVGDTVPFGNFAPTGSVPNMADPIGGYPTYATTGSLTWQIVSVDSPTQITITLVPNKSLGAVPMSPWGPNWTTTMAYGWLTGTGAFAGAGFADVSFSGAELTAVKGSAVPGGFRLPTATEAKATDWSTTGGFWLQPSAPNTPMATTTDAFMSGTATTMPTTTAYLTIRPIASIDLSDAIFQLPPSNPGGEGPKATTSTPASSLWTLGLLVLAVGAITTAARTKKGFKTFLRMLMLLALTVALVAVMASSAFATTISDLDPADGSFTATPPTQLSAKLDSAVPFLPVLGSQMVVVTSPGGVNEYYFSGLSAGFTFPASPGGSFVITPFPFTEEGAYRVYAQVWDASWGVAEKTWGFTVGSGTPVVPSTAEYECIRCHPVSEHAFTDCDNCHGPERPRTPEDHFYTDDIEFDHPAVVGMAHCMDCHDPAKPWKDIPVSHDWATIDAKHGANTAGCSATLCHYDALTKNHAKLDEEGCFICHTDAAIKPIIYDKNAKCLDCHEGTLAMEPHYDGVVVKDFGIVCNDCHEIGSPSGKYAANSTVLFTVEPDTHAMVLQSEKAGDPSCAVCHTRHDADDKVGKNVAKTSPEICFGCHDASRTQGAVDIDIDNNKAIKHADIAAGGRKASCSDCHADAHDATPIDSANRLSVNALTGVSGVSYVKSNLPDYEGRGLDNMVGANTTTAGARTTLNLWARNPWAGELAEVTLDGEPKDYQEGEWMVCFKCHAGTGGNIGPWNSSTRYGNWNGTTQGASQQTGNNGLTLGYLPNRLTNLIGAHAGAPATGSTGIWYTTDLAREFNPNNPSGHRVVANPNGTVAGWGFTRVFNTGQTNPDGTTGVDKRLSSQAGALSAVTITSYYADSGGTAPATAGNAPWLYNDRATALFANGLTKANLEAQGAIFGLTEQSVLKCTDCHTGAAGGAQGPHGASSQFLLDERWNKRDWKDVTIHNMTQVTGPNAYICAKCHYMGNAAATGQLTTALPNTAAGMQQDARPATTSTGLKLVHFYATAVGSNSSHSEANYTLRCGQCHIAIPHGWKRPRLLVSVGDDYGTPYCWQGVSAPSDSSTNYNNRAGWNRMGTNLSRTNPAAAWSSNQGCQRFCNTHGNMLTTNYLP